MYFTIYKITNKLNNKYYIGKHQTKSLDDGYMGSGKLLKRAIEKYGIENFTKEILFVFDNEQEMNDKEKELVLVSEESYNLCEGGKGGFGYINSKNLNNKNHDNVAEKIRQHMLGKKNPRLTVWLKEQHKNGKIKYNTYGMQGKKHSEKSKEKMSFSQSSRNNSQFGTFWVTNGVINMKCKTEIPEGFWKGRKI